MFPSFRNPEPLQLRFLANYRIPPCLDTNVVERADARECPETAVKLNVKLQNCFLGYDVIVSREERACISLIGARKGNLAMLCSLGSSL